MNFNLRTPLFDERHDQMPLHVAVTNGDLQRVTSLLARGADIQAHSEDGKTPLQTAVACENIEMIKLLLQHDAYTLNESYEDCNPMHDAIEFAQNLEVVQVLLEHARTLPGMVDPGWLSWAVIVQRPEMVEFLVEQGFDVNYSEYDRCTPIMYITKRGISNYKHAETIIKLLLEAGADINAVNMFDDTVLHNAVNQHNPKLVELLCRYGADVESLNNHNQTPLISAVDYLVYTDTIEMNSDFHRCVYRVVNVLITFGANIYHLDANGWSALDYAVKSNLRAAYALAPKYNDQHLLVVRERHKAMFKSIKSNNHGYCAVILTLAKRVFVKHQAHQNFVKVLRFANLGLFGAHPTPEAVTRIPLDIQLEIAAQHVAKEYFCAEKFLRYVERHCENTPSAPSLALA